MEVTHATTERGTTLLPRPCPNKLQAAANWTQSSTKVPILDPAAVVAASEVLLVAENLAAVDAGVDAGVESAAFPASGAPRQGDMGVRAAVVSVTAVATMTTKVAPVKVVALPMRMQL